MLPFMPTALLCDRIYQHQDQEQHQPRGPPSSYGHSPPLADKPHPQPGEHQTNQSLFLQQRQRGSSDAHCQLLVLPHSSDQARIVRWLAGGGRGDLFRNGERRGVGIVIVCFDTACVVSVVS
jgi:hypothetical protein